jgi:hypothetical protein
MVLLDETVMVFHGGVPHTDVTPHLETLADLHNESEKKFPTNPLEDFIWLRLHKTAPEKIPNRGTHGADEGYKDFDAFIKKLSSKLYLGVCPSLAIRGHDHQEDNYKHFEKYTRSKLVTVNALTLNRSSGKRYNDLAIVRWQPNAEPSAPLDISVFKIKVPQSLVDSVNRDPDFKSIIAAGYEDFVEPEVAVTIRYLRRRRMFCRPPSLRTLRHHPSKRRSCSK